MPTTSIADYETGVTDVPPEDLGIMQAAFEAAGVEFIDRGVRLAPDAEARRA